MGMETLNSAVHAAGFAMAASDEPHEASRSVPAPEVAPWRPGEAVLTRGTTQPGRFPEWARSLFGMFGRRAPASPA